MKKTKVVEVVSLNQAYPNLDEVLTVKLNEGFELLTIFGGRAYFVKEEYLQ